MKAFSYYGAQSNRSQVIQGWYFVCLLHRDSTGHFEAGRNSLQREGAIDDIYEHYSQLDCTCSEFSECLSDLHTLSEITNLMSSSVQCLKVAPAKTVVIF